MWILSFCLNFFSLTIGRCWRLCRALLSTSLAAESAQGIWIVKDNELYESCSFKHLLVKRWSPNSHLFQIIPGISNKPSKKARQSKRRYYTYYYNRGKHKIAYFRLRPTTTLFFSCGKFTIRCYFCLCFISENLNFLLDLLPLFY